MAAGQLTSLAHRLARPPVREGRFWAVQVMVVGLAAAHLTVDILSGAESSFIPAGIPVALLLAPVSYAALRYGLSGAVATALWATLLWLPDLLLPSDRGHPGNDLIDLALVIAVAVFVGQHIDAERREHAQAERARSEQQAAQARYRQLFDTNAAPILVAGPSGAIVDANPAARSLVAGDVTGQAVGDVLGASLDELGGGGRTVDISAPRAARREFRVHSALLRAGPTGEPLTQLVLHDVTEERAEGDRARRFAELLLRVQEEERKRIARELHDEPLQLLIHLARSLERLATAPPESAPLATELTGARRQALDVASQLRAVVAGLRPPALEQLGLAAAIRGFLADTGETSTVRTDLHVTGTEARLTAETELAAFRIAQEAVNNAVHHARARRISLTLAFGGSGLCLRVADDGRGFDLTASDIQLHAGHVGILGMRERAALVGGDLVIRSAPGDGTTVEARFPGGGERS